MRKQFQRSWHGIKFRSFFEVSSTKVASLDFYNRFYEQFFEVYNSYSDIPDEYVKNRIVVATYLETRLKSKKSALSIGCGIGLIEKMLVEEGKLTAKLTAIEPSSVAIKWISKNPKIAVYNGFFPDVIADETHNFDFAYARAIDYIFDQKEYINFLRSVLDFGIKEFTIISVCIHRRSPISILKELIKIFLSKINLYDRGQFWGYLRTEEDHRIAFLEAGFEQVDIQYLAESTMVVTGPIKKNLYV